MRSPKIQQILGDYETNRHRQSNDTEQKRKAEERHAESQESKKAKREAFIES
jgi:hypothetical protein